MGDSAAEEILPAVTAKKIDVSKALELRLKGMTYRDIAKYFGCKHQSVWGQLQGLVPENVDLAAYKQHRADILAGKQGEIIKSLTVDDIKKATAYQRVGMFSLLYDKERLERGESTQNIHNLNETASKINDLQAQEHVLMIELGQVDPDEDVADMDLDEIDKEISELLGDQ